METCLRILGKVQISLGVTVLSIVLTACGGGGGGISADTPTGSISTTGDDTSSTSTDTSNTSTDTGNTSTDTSNTADGGTDTSNAPDNTGTGDDGGGSTEGAVDIAPPAPELGSASLNWQAPVERADGEPLSASEIGGYRIYYGTASGAYAYVIEVDDASATSYVINDLPLDDYYFVLTAIDSTGRESGYSNEAVKQVQS